MIDFQFNISLHYPRVTLGPEGFVGSNFHRYKAIWTRLLSSFVILPFFRILLSHVTLFFLLLCLPFLLLLLHILFYLFFLLFSFPSTSLPSSLSLLFEYYSRFLLPLSPLPLCSLFIFLPIFPIPSPTFPPYLSTFFPLFILSLSAPPHFFSSC